MSLLQAYRSMNFKIRSCINCGSFLLIKNSLCEHCYKSVITQFSSQPLLLISGHKTRSLLKWNPGESDVLSMLIHLLKMDQYNLWNKLAFDFLRKNNIRPDCRRVLVTLKATSSNHTHAQDWGQSLAGYLACDHIMALDKVSVDAQKKKGKSERDKVRLKSIVDISRLSNKKVIFVDDVVTTGSTLKAAYEALGSPKEFECWTMAVRTVGSIAD